MLSSNQIEVLQHILDNDVVYIENLAKANGLSNPEASVGVAKFLVADSENFSKMSVNQKYHYDNGIKALINKVPCDGMIGMHEDGTSSCIGNEFIEGENLLMAYQTNDMRCQQCMDETERWHHNHA